MHNIVIIIYIARMLEDTTTKVQSEAGVNRRNTQYNGQRKKDKPCCTKHYTKQN